MKPNSVTFRHRAGKLAASFGMLLIFTLLWGELQEPVEHAIERFTHHAHEWEWATSLIFLSAGMLHNYAHAGAHKLLHAAIHACAHLRKGNAQKGTHHA